MMNNPERSCEVALDIARANRIEQWPVDRLIPYVRNARKHSDAQIAKLAASIREFGFNNAILIDSLGGIIAGHGRLQAARKLGLEMVRVVVLDHLSETDKRAYILADNRIADEAGWDADMLAVEIASLQEQNVDLALTGFTEEELAKLRRAEEYLEGAVDEDTVPAVPKQPVSMRGDLWQLGSHRLLCGDATCDSDVHRLMADELADLVFTDPPYNVNYEGYTDARLSIAGDSMSEGAFKQFLAATFTSYRRILAGHASLYICHPSRWQREFQDALEAAGFEIRCQIIWAKNTFAWGFGRYKFRHEPMFYVHVAGEKDLWFGDRTQSTLWEEDKPAANRVHPTAKPTALVERALVNSSPSGAIVADLFGGSGSTLIACERRGRKARVMEIDPAYCDVIAQRWQDYRRTEAVLDGSGQNFREVAMARVGHSENRVPGACRQ